MLRKLALIFILTIITLGATGCSRTSDVCTGLSENEAQRICVLLQRNGLPASKVRVGSEDTVSWTVAVSTSFVLGDEGAVSALKILSENDLPRSKENPYTDAFSKNSLIPTQAEETLRKLAATQKAIELTLETINGVVSAKVNLVLPDPNPLVNQSDQIKATASVLLKYNTKESPLDINEIRSLVAPAVQGLDPEKVKVVLKAVPAPDALVFDDAKTRAIRIIGLAGIGLVGILMAALIFCFVRMRKLSEKVVQLERSTALRTTSKSSQPAIT